MAASTAFAVMAVEVQKCDHQPGKQLMKAVNKYTSARALFYDIHPDIDEKIHTVLCAATTELQGCNEYEVDMNLPVGEIIQFGAKVLRFRCKANPKASLVNEVEAAVEKAKEKAVDAFQILMSGGRSFPKKKTSSSGMKTGLNNKDVLYNNVIDLCVSMGADFPKSIADSDGSYFVQVLCNAVWYITNQTTTINDTAQKQKDVIPVPDIFEQFAGYTDTKRKKIKSQPMTASALKGHSEALFSLLDKPYTNSSTGKWPDLKASIESFAECLSSYQNYLEKQRDTSKSNKALLNPPRTVDENASVFHCKKSIFLNLKYALLDKAVSESNEPVIFREDIHVDKPFESGKQKQRFFENLGLSVSVDVIKFCPGGAAGTTYIVSKVLDEDRSDVARMTDVARLVQRMKPHLKEYHTRAQKRQFKRKVENIAKIQPALLDFIYTELALDASAMAHPGIQQRIRLISFGQCGLVSDLRHFNPGRPSDRYDVFFQKLYERVEEISAADDRRHGPGIAHLSQWISLSDMIEETTKSCPEGTPIPSKDLVKLQFAPTNPYTRAAHRFTSKIPLQYKIQRRQLRIQHEDAHYCAALYKYLRSKAIELKDDVVLFSSDDKAKVPIGEPGAPISTGVRGRVSIAPVSSDLACLDHDMNATTITPSVVLKCSIPEKPTDSFVRGEVTTFINDTVTQPASPFRHAVHLKKILERDHVPSILLKYTDGGTDQRNTLESVKSANICLFRELNLDLLIAVRCAPGQSYINPAERVMSILNYGLQNVATERERVDEESEKKFKQCNSVATLREAIKKNPDLEEKWIESLSPVQFLIRDRFERLKLKEKPIVTMDPVTVDEIDILQRHLRELFPELNLQKLQKVHTNKCKMYLEWKEKHCRETQYTFQIRKCQDNNCCAPRNQADEKLQWLPEPVLDETGEHFLPYSEVRTKETTEKDRPSLKVDKTKKKTGHLHRVIDEEAEPCQNRVETATFQNRIDKETHKESFQNTIDVESNVALTGQNARATAVCVECRKPRVVYSNTRLNQRKQVLLATCLSEYEYTCGSHLFPPSVSIEIRKSVVLRPSLQCATPVEIPYYVGEVGRKDVCSFCGQPEAVTDPELKKVYKTVLPICQGCRQEGREPIVQRKFGKTKK